MRLNEKNLLQKFAATLKKFSAHGAKKVEYGMACIFSNSFSVVYLCQKFCNVNIESENPEHFGDKNKIFITNSQLF